MRLLTSCNGQKPKSSSRGHIRDHLLLASVYARQWAHEADRSFDGSKLEGGIKFSRPLLGSRDELGSQQCVGGVEPEKRRRRYRAVERVPRIRDGTWERHGEKRIQNV